MLLALTSLSLLLVGAEVIWKNSRSTVNVDVVYECNQYGARVNLGIGVPFKFRMDPARTFKRRFNVSDGSDDRLVQASSSSSNSSVTHVRHKEQAPETLLERMDREDRETMHIPETPSVLTKRQKELLAVKRAERLSALKRVEQAMKNVVSEFLGDNVVLADVQLRGEFTGVSQLMAIVVSGSYCQPTDEPAYSRRDHANDSTFFRPSVQPGLDSEAAISLEYNEDSEGFSPGAVWAKPVVASYDVDSREGASSNNNDNSSNNNSGESRPGSSSSYRFGGGSSASGSQSVPLLSDSSSSV